MSEEVFEFGKWEGCRPRDLPFGDLVWMIRFARGPEREAAWEEFLRRQTAKRQRRCYDRNNSYESRGFRAEQF